MASQSDNYQNGLAVKRQATIYERILDGRIQLQKSITSLNKALDIVQQNESYAEDTEVQSLISEAQDKIFELLEDLIQLRRRLLESNEIDIPALPTLRKRKRVSGHYKTSVALSDASSPYRTAVLEKWSRKVQSANGVGALASSKKFSVLNQSISFQIADLLRDMDRLVARTRVDRNASAGGAKAANESKRVERVSDDSLRSESFIYDDTDFYQMLLKDLVEKNMADSDVTSSALASGVKWTVSKQKVKKPDLDTKASKGRKLRYHVQEKIQNFMAPEPQATWNEEQIDDLFSGLFGQKIMDVVNE
ncbi:apoptosis-antagonizing transcription factor [Myxozyma melibiosi]|uniref:Protein BFR2 n=1 Tax=Myxozyma melibiosi TaxID=54550 RepID=A0ABR1FFB1_9ASCO